jgi:flagellar motor switch protein FliG
VETSLHVERPAGRESSQGIELEESLLARFADHSSPPSDAASDDESPPPFRFLHEATSDTLARHLEKEHPQITAVVIAHLPPRRAAELIKRLPERMQVDILRRVAELDQADPHVLRDLELQLERLLSDDIRAARNRSAGLAAVAGILKAAGNDQRVLLQHVARHDQQLMSQLRDLPAPQPPPAPVRSAPASDNAPPSDVVDQPKPAAARPQQQQPAASKTETRQPHAAPAPTRQLDFEDLFRLDDRMLATLLREAGPQLTLLALAGAREALVERIIRQLSPTEATSLRRRMEQIGPVRLADIEHAQQSLARLAGELADRGVITPPTTRRFAVAA